MEENKKTVCVITANQWAGHIGNRVSYLGEIWTLKGVSDRPAGIWLELSHPKHGSMPTQATDECKPYVWNVEKMNAAEMAELSKTFLFKDVTVTELKYIDNMALNRIVKIVWHIFNGGNGRTDAGPDQLRWLDSHGYFTGQFPEGSYVVEEVKNDVE